MGEAVPAAKQNGSHIMTSTTEKNSIYLENGFANRRAYLENLADEFGIDKATVFMMAQMLGRNEDFDGLICALEDEADRLCYA